MNIKLLFFFKVFILLFPVSFCGLTVYPDHYVPSDSPYSYLSLHSLSDIKQRQIYKLGYFTDGTDTIVSYKTGFLYKPDNTCEGTKLKSDNKANNLFFETILNKESTRDNNFSEELELLSNICYGNSLTIGAPFPTLHNTGYILRYKLVMACLNNTSTNINIYLKRTNYDEELICSFSMKTLADWYFMTIYSTLSQSNKITMSFLCDLTEEKKSFIVNTNEEYKLVIKEESNKVVYLSFYQIILEDSTDYYLSSINENKIIRTYNGLEKCDEEENNKCLLGYNCKNNTCKSCHFTCEQCSDLSENDCIGCTPITFPHQSIDQSTCPINNIDMTNFKDIEVDVPVENSEFHERSTLGMWIFISDLSKARNGNCNIFHIVLKDRYVLSVVPNEITVDVYCHAYEDLYRKITSEVTLQANYADKDSEYVLRTIIPSEQQLKYINSKDLSGQWFHVSCGLSLDHEKFYIGTMVNGEGNSEERRLLHENLYYDSKDNKYVYNDEYNRHIIEDGGTLHVSIKNFGNAGTKIYLKYFLLFQEYIPREYKFMYYDYFDSGLDQILIQIPFDELIVEHGLEEDKYYLNIKNTSDFQLEIKLNIYKEIDLTTPINFVNLILPKTNSVYKDIQCKSESGNTKELLDIGSNINWDDNKPLFCDGFLDTLNDKCLGKVNNCDIDNKKYIIFPSYTDQKGYCDYLCSQLMVDCNNVYNDNNFCENSDDIYNLFYSCKNKETKYYLQYSSFYNPGSFGVDIDSLDSYIIELWYYPDFFLSDSNRQGKYYFPETYKNFIFYSNVVHAYFLHSEYKTLKVEDAYSTHTTPYYHPFEWNKLVFHGLYKDNTYFKFFYINNIIDDPIEFKHVKNETEGLLTSISFSPHLYVEGTYEQWASGYYKDLRIWQGNGANVPLTILYNNLFSNDADFRTKAIYAYYPMTNEYIRDNTIWEISNKKNMIVKSETKKKLRRYNFSSKFDFIRSQYESLGYYLLADSTSPKASQCGTGCLRCWNSGKSCYECSEGYQLTLYRTCEIIPNYYFKTPCVICSEDDDYVKLIIENEVYDRVNTNPITVTFWIKVFGFVNDNSINIIYYSSNDYLHFVDGDNSLGQKGLSLISDGKIISNDPNFRERIGFWSFISLSHYRDMSEGEYNTFFHNMINFEIDGNSLDILNINKNLYFDEFKINNGLFSLIFNLKYYHDYIIGTYGYETNRGNLIAPFSIPNPIYSYFVPASSPSNCFNTKDIENPNNYGCGGDKDNIFDLFATTFNQYTKINKTNVHLYGCEFKNDYANSESQCLNACTGTKKNSCTCTNKNYNSQMLIWDGKNIYCRTFVYINFAKAKKITVNHIRTAKETKKYTLQFWVYFHNYEEGNFDGAEFYWKGHNKITIFKKKVGSQYKYYATCITDQINKNEDIKYEEQLINEKWNFISCSSNYDAREFYLITYSDLGKYNGLTSTYSYPAILNPLVDNDYLLNNDWTYLQISENSKLKDWGYLFYRQIHLWKSDYFNVEFLSRVYIQTPSKFPYLLHSWDTFYRGFKDGNFKNNFILTDIVHVAEDFNVTYTGTLGFNYIKEVDSKRNVSLCSEDGEYYDLNLNSGTCLPFADLGLIDDFAFTGVPFSYSGSYSMAFWIFFEDSSAINLGVHFKWERHLQITVIQSTRLLGYCLPQGYYSDDISNDEFFEKINKVKNYNFAPIVEGSQSGKWIWVICSVSNYYQKYFIKGNINAVQSNIITEDLYYSDNEEIPVKNVYPYHYFMSEVESGIPQTSNLVLEGISNEKRIYIRNLYLFKDYIPEWYAEEFKYVDLTQFEQNMMLQSMVFACNFADFNLNKMTLNYYVINQNKAGTDSTFTKTLKSVKLYRSSKISSSKTFELSTNFDFIGIVNPKSTAQCSYSGVKNFYYCNKNNIPIVCKNGYYITLNSNNKVICSNTCNNLIRVPGTPSYSGICSIPKKDNTLISSYNYNSLIDYKNKLLCESNYYQIGYLCYEKELDEKSAFFFSRCYNQPNFYREISNESKQNFPNGYFFEFWFKLDKVQILEHCETTANEEYILFSTPHSIYLDLTENKYYYKIIDSIYSRQLDGISDYEWNKIVIKTTLGVTSGQNAYVYINFDIDNIKASILNIPSSIKMQLQYISFCSKEDNGYCTSAGPIDIVWGSAYYRNIRVWELFSSSIYSIQDFNIEIYKDIPLSLKLFYPLTISQMNFNILSQTIGNKGLDNIEIIHKESSNFNSLDAYGFFNYATNFDWGVESEDNKKRFISQMDGSKITSQPCGTNCERCYSSANTNCYKCNEGYVLKGMTCVATDNYYYLKIPLDSKQKVEFNIDNVANFPGITIHFYMKFEGVLQNPSTTSPHIMEFRDNTYIYYNTLNAYLEFNIEGETAFRYTTFYDILGIWIPYSISIYSGDILDKIPERYPNMFTFSVNKEDIPFISTYVLPDTLNKISDLSLGTEVIALFADLRIYKTFMQGSFGHAISSEKGNGIIISYPLRSTNKEMCLLPYEVKNPINVNCVSDYIDYMSKSCDNDITKYFDLSIAGEIPCASCDEYCKTKCFNPSRTQCNCDMTHGLYWLRRDKKTRVTYCEYLPSTDYSFLNDVSFNVPVSKSFESTIEFWLFIYSYNSETSHFTSISLEWDLHNKIIITNKANTITANCYAFFKKDNENEYTEYISLVIAGYKWIYIRCGTDYISQTKKYFLNNQEEELITNNYPERNGVDVTTFKIKTEKPYSYGFVFLREIKLWQQYNFKYINTQYINLINDVGLYDLSINKSKGIYPGLITYITSEFNQEEYLSVMDDYKYKLVNLVGKDDEGYAYPRTYTFVRNNDPSLGFIGYNIIDPDNYGYYEDLLICGAGYVYNSENGVCDEVTLTKCRYPGDTSDNCISCPDENKFIYPPNGNCVDDCGVRFYPREDMNQCRDCHFTCYTCSSYAYNNCLSCIDDRYLVEDLHICVLQCQEYGLVESKYIPNMCVDFEVLVELVNYKEGVPIDINTFDYLIAEIKNINTKVYFTKWSFNPTKTRNANKGKELKFEDDEVPFEPNTIENLENLNVSLNHSFFELNRSYIFTIEITSYNILNNTKRATRYFDFNLTMNSPPVDGGIEIIPSNGLHNTTVFLMRCQNWTDDTIVNETELTYSFFYIENSSEKKEEKLIQDWSTNNELIKIFAMKSEDSISNDITIICKVRDNYLAENKIMKNITITNDLNSGIYSLDAALKEYYIPDKQLRPSELYHLSEVLKSFGIDLYKALRPKYQTTYMPSINKDSVEESELKCITENKECNNRGECTINIDVFLVCRCEEGYVGTNCHIEKSSGEKLLVLYKELYSKLLGTMQSTISYDEFRVMHNIFEGAKYFSEDTNFFSEQMQIFLDMALNTYPISIDNNTYEYIDLLDYYYSYELYRLNTKRVTKKFNTGLSGRDIPIDNQDKSEFKNSFEYIHNKLIELIHYKCNMHINTQIAYEYSSDNFYISIKSVNPTFDENEFFEERKNNYRSFPRFMTCLNYIENTKLNNPYFQTFMIYIEYLNFPFGYDDGIYKVNTGPLIELRFLDATTGKDFDLTDCTGPNYINIDMPFTNYRWLEQINKQRLLYDPRNYKSPNDPIFSDPIYINKSGYVSDDTVEERIKAYHREYNFACKYYDIEKFQFLDTGVVFTNYTSDTNFIEFNTSHLSRFSTFFVLNNETYKIKGRFFYVPRTELMKWKGNYNGNFGFFVFIFLIAAYVICSIVLGLYDSLYFVKESLLESLKKEIIKVFLPYRTEKEKEKEASKLIPIELDPKLIKEKKFGDKLNENNRYGKETQEDLKEEKGSKKPKDDLRLSRNTKISTESSERLKLSRGAKNKSKEHLSRKKKGDESLNETVLKDDIKLDLDLEIKNFYRMNLGKKDLFELNPNRLPDTFETKDIEYKRRLYGYSNLGLSFCQFFGKNFLQRNILITPFFNISLFAPRWKKLIGFTTEIALEMLLLAVFLTNDEKATDENLVLLVQYSVYTVLITDAFMHFFAIFLQVSDKQKRRLLKIILLKGQLIVLKEYEDMQCINTFITVIGLSIGLVIWGFSFYMSFTFYSVWKVQNRAFIDSFFITIVIDFFVLEFIYELFLSIIYTQRKSSELFKRLGEFLNRVRNHRCMS